MADPKKLSLLSSAADVEKRFLAGPRDRAKDLESAIRYFLEFLRGFETLGAIDRPCVTVFGSARLGEGTPYYDTVSYTHLDVYKRQVLHTASSIISAVRLCIAWPRMKAVGSL